MNKQDKKIASARAKMDRELTWDDAVDSIITTPQAQRTPYQIATANLNPELKSRNKRYQSAFNNVNILENERVNLWQAWELMMNAYRDAMQNTQDAAERMMNANSAQAAIQAWWAISWSAWLSTNPAAAAQTRIAAQNQANIQNMQIRSNADQNIANLASWIASIPSNLASISSNNAQIDSNKLQAEANANLANAQAWYYNRQWTATSWWSRTYSQWESSNWWQSEDEWELSTVVNWVDVTKLEVRNVWDNKFQLYNPSTNSIINDQAVMARYYAYQKALEANKQQ